MSGMALRDLTEAFAEDEVWGAWDAARRQAGDAYDAWSQAEIVDRRDAFAVFVAAADQEAAAESAFLSRRRLSRAIDSP